MKKSADQYIRLFFFFGFASYFLIYEALREKIMTDDDLMTLSGRITHYEFKDNTGFKRNGYQYYIYLDGFSNKFQIPANFLRHFNKDRFERSVSPNDIIDFSIPKYQQALLDSSKPILIYSLMVNSISYYSKNETLAFEPDNSNYYLSILFFTGGFGLLLYYRLKKATNNA